MELGKDQDLSGGPFTSPLQPVARPDSSKMSSERRKESHIRCNSVPETPREYKRINKKWQVDDGLETIWSGKSADENDTELILFSNEFIVIKPSAEKGFGTFAAKDLRRGTRIIEEEPVILLPQAGYGEKEIVSEFVKLPDMQQEKFMELHYRLIGDEAKIAAIFNSNCYRNGDGAALFINCSRINHACVPNAHVTWNENIQRQTCQLVRDVKAGEEITINYVSSGIEDTAGRQEFLRSYGFTCECEVCVPSTLYGRGSEQRRQVIRAINQRIDGWWTTIESHTGIDQHIDAKHLIMELIEQLKEEGIVGPPLAEAYNAAYECALLQGRPCEAFHWAMLELEVDTYTVGSDSPFADETLANIQRIESTYTT